MNLKPITSHEFRTTYFDKIFQNKNFLITWFNKAVGVYTGFGEEIDFFNEDSLNNAQSIGTIEFRETMQKKFKDGKTYIIKKRQKPVGIYSSFGTAIEFKKDKR